ncbi:MAG: hydroxymethylbilane synthase [Aquisalinus sp.]|nr:hydroxymethylbilane synthase [Aquisalinus sp.]
MRSKLARHLGISETDYNDCLAIKTYVTQGDKRLAGSLASIGGKGLFTKEIEHALLNGEADIAVHSMKDMPAEMPDGLVTVAVPAREDPRDAFISDLAKSPWELPQSAVFGTSSVRRAAQLLHRRPDLKIVPLRGNVDRRLEKLNEGQADATLLAEAGLRRLDKADVTRTVLEPDEMLPAVSQGVLCVQMRQDDERIELVQEALACEQTSLISSAERAFLLRLDGSCQTPIAGLARLKGNTLSFRAQLLTLDGAQELTITESAEITHGSHSARLTAASEFGFALAERIFKAAPKAIQDIVRAA